MRQVAESIADQTTEKSQEPSHDESLLGLVGGLRLIDGGTSTYDRRYILLDSFTSRYFRLGTVEKICLSHWKAGVKISTLITFVQQDLPNVDITQIKGFIAFIYEHGLVNDHSSQQREKLRNHQRAQERFWWQKLAHGYLFVRIHLFDPTPILPCLAKIFRPFYYRIWHQLMIILGCVALLTAFIQWSRLIDEFWKTLNPSGILLYLLVLIAVKIGHEFSHAVTAHRLGCQVTSMGFALLVLWPILFTNTTAAWQLPERKQRAIIDAAGIIFELQICILALLSWLILPTTGWSQVFLIVAITTLVGTLAINLNPLMRFDGYYLISDWFGIDNLSATSNQCGKLAIRKYFLSIRPTNIELANITSAQSLSTGDVRRLTLFSWATWIYRLLLFGGIALLVYQLFFPPLGPLLALIEIGYFILLPIMNEFRQWYRLRHRIVWKTTLIRSGSAIALLIGLLFVPFVGSKPFDAILVSSRTVDLYTPSDGLLASDLPSEQTLVESNDIVATLTSPSIAADLVTSKANAQAQREISRRKAFLLVRQRNGSAEVNIARSNAQLAKHQKNDDRLTVRAPFAGMIRDVNPDLTLGSWTQAQTKIATLIDPTHWELRSYVPLTRATHLNIGDLGIFRSSDGHHPPISVRIIAIHSVATRRVADSVFMALFGGQIAGQKIIPTPRHESSSYQADVDLVQVHLEPLQQQPPWNHPTFLTQRVGTVQIESSFRPIWIDLWHWMRQLFRKESHL